MPPVEPSAQLSIVSPDEPLHTRLHIAPLSAELLKNILPSVSPEILQSVSYHRIPTFPENNYGYVTLPTPAAQALKKKYHGAYLRGAKMKVDEARPEKKRKREVEQAEEDVEEAKKSTKRNQKHAKLEEGVLPAVELAEGRHVKRGWAGSAKEKKTSKNNKEGRKSKSKDKGQLAFRTSVPGGQHPASAEEQKKDRKKSKSKKTEIKEFEKTTQFPRFLKQQAANSEAVNDTTFIEGKGWVDGEGSVVEAVISRKARAKTTGATQRKPPSSGSPPTRRDKASSDPTTEALKPSVDESSEDDSSQLSSSSASSSSSSVSSDDGQDGPESMPEISHSRSRTKSPLVPSTEAPTPSLAPPLTSPSKSKSPLVPSTEAATPILAQPFSPTPPGRIDVAGLPDILSPIKDSSVTVHPLEALFKRPAPPSNSSTATPGSGGKRRPAPAPLNTAFSFGFDADGNEIGEDDQTPDAGSGSMTAMPQTPFTSRDRFARGIRSAAPTPDTAAIGKRFSWMSDEDEEEEDVEHEPEDAGEVRLGDQTIEETAQDTHPEQNEFEKHFYAQRGEYNKAWKARRREARKEVRQVENRRFGVGR